MKADVVIIGSGISGLTAAAILAAKGRKVVIIEKQPRIGGALKRFRRGNIPFDVGFHYTGCLGQGDILHLLWHYCSVLHRLEVLPFPAEGHDRLYINGYPPPVRAYFSYTRFTDELKQHFPAEQGAIDQYFQKIEHICRSIPFYNTKLPLTDFLQGYKPKGHPLSEFLEKITDNRFLQATLANPAILYGVPTDQVSIDVHAMVAHSYYTGAYGIAGGGQAIVDAFQARLQEADTEFLTDRAVASILVDDHGVTGIRTDREETIESDYVIHTGHPSALIDMVPDGCFRPAFRNRLIDLKNSISMFALFGTVSATPGTKAFLDWTNHISIPEGPNSFPPSLKTRSTQRSLMLTCTERTANNTLQPQIKSVILLQPAFWEEVAHFHHCRKGNRPPAYSRLKHTITEQMLQTAEKKWGDYLGPIRPLAMGTPLTFRDELSAPEGCAYGAMHCLNQYNPRPRTRVPGLLLSGQSTLMTGIVGASISGMVSAGEILGLESLWQEIRRWS
jgi:all-trans-retinol 13,14-reductase